MRRIVLPLLAIVIAMLYLSRVEADSISGLFGIHWLDEGTYLLAAKNQTLFGTAHFFPGDVWRPELTAPLLHYFALLTITPTDPLFWVRTGMALLVLAGAALIAWKAADKPLLCFCAILLNPVLYFYARIGLSEGLQFFLLALVIACLHQFYKTAHYLPAMLCGALTAVLFWSKINSIDACFGIVAGLLAALYYHRPQALSPLPSRERVRVRVLSLSLPTLTPPPSLEGRGRSLGLLLAYLLAALIVTALFFLLLGPDSAAWWQRNIAFEAARRTPSTVWFAIETFFYKMAAIGYYTALMPVIGVYLLALLIPRHCEVKPKQSSPSTGSEHADKLDCRAALAMTGGFTRILLIITLTTLILESFFGGEIRRNFFNLALLSILGGLTASDYIAHGIALRPLSPLKLTALALVILHILGIGFVLGQAALHGDAIYILLSALFLGIMLLAFFAPSQRARLLLLSLAALSSLTPMAYNSFLTPNTVQEAATAIEDSTAPDAIIAGHIAPWTWTSVKRRIVFTNCLHSNFTVDFANDLSGLPVPVTYYMATGIPKQDQCRPADFAYYKPSDHYILFLPRNDGIEYPGSKEWVFRADYFVLHKNHAE